MKHSSDQTNPDFVLIRIVKLCVEYTQTGVIAVLSGPLGLHGAPAPRCLPCAGRKNGFVAKTFGRSQ